MTDDSKHTIGDKSAHQGDGAQKLDNSETKELVNAGGTAMRGIESKRTNVSSGSFDESQELSVEIDFGNGRSESRLTKSAAGDANELVEKSKSISEPIKSLTLGALSPLMKVAELDAFPVSQVSSDRAIAQSVVLRPSDVSGKASASDLPLNPRDMPQHKYNPETHDKNGFVKDPIGYGLTLAQAKPETVRTDVPAPAAPLPHPIKREVAPAPSPIPPPLLNKPGDTHAPELPVAPLSKAVSPELSPAPKPIDNADLARKALEQINARQREELSATETLSQSRAALEANVRAVITNPVECNQFLSDMRTFESDYVKRSLLDRAHALVEIAETYKQVDRLLTATSDAIPLTNESMQKPGDTPWRVQIAEQVMHHAADPMSVSQGVLAVCSTESLQVRQYFREPNSIAKLVADVAITGKYTAKTADKSINVLEKFDNLSPDSFARLYNLQDNISGKPVHLWGKSYSGARSFASQIFDVTTIDLAVSGKGYRYRLPTPEEVEKDKNNAQGGLVDSNNRFIPWRSALANLAPGDSDLVKLNRWITGKYEPGFVIAGARGVGSEQSPFVRELFEFHNARQDATTITRAEQLPSILRQLKDVNQFPVIIAVDASMPPINSKGSGAHYVTITEVSEDGRKLSYDNTWGQSKDHNGDPSVDSVELAQSCLSSKLITFDWVSSNQGHIQSLAGADVWSNAKKELQTLSSRLNKDGTRMNASDCPEVFGNFAVKSWLVTHPWDQKLTEFQKVIDRFVSKYPPNK